MIKNFLKEEYGGMSIEAAIITAVLVALAIVFKKQIGQLWEKVGGQMAEMQHKIETDT